eukprot:scaffold137346_cov148-Phaeocystis_antarctica.AAC.1
MTGPRSETEQHCGAGLKFMTDRRGNQAFMLYIHALERSTATIHADRMMSPVVVTVSAASVDVHVDAASYRPPSTTVFKK